MSKLIAVSGSPGGGKTTSAIKLAQEIQSNSNGVVIYISFDWKVPSLSYVFPQHKTEELFSIGKIFNLTEIYKEDVLKQTVTAKEMPNLGYLGFKSGENRYTYPFPTEDKVINLFEILKGLADYIVADCTDNTDDIVSKYALKKADVIINVISPDLKGITYLASADKTEFDTEQSLNVINTIHNDVYLPVDEVTRHCREIKTVLPYSSEIKKQSITGTLANEVNDKCYKAALTKIIKEVI